MAAPAPAHAQYFDPFDEVISPRAIVWRLNDRGFTEISRPRFDGRAYVVEAESPRGGRVRLIVDARDGAVLGRVRLDTPLLPPARIGRPGNVYGWTEGDVAARRGDIERPIPPGNIPNAPDLAQRSPLRGAQAARTMPDRFAPDRSESSSRSDSADPNSLGLNPDAARRSPERPRKIVRLPPQAKPPGSKMPERGSETARTAAPAPIPALKPADTEASAPKPEQPVAAIEAPKAAPTPAAVQPPAPERTAAPADAKPSAPSWTDPPAENKRAVRVIDGATVVPGTSEKSAGAAE